VRKLDTSNASGAEQAGILYSTTSSQSVEGRVEPEMGSDDQAGRIESERELDTEPAVRVVEVSRQRKQLLRRRAQRTRKRLRNEEDSTNYRIFSVAILRQPPYTLR